MRKEYPKLHDRYTELFKTHMDYMERTKILLGTDRLDQLSMLRPKAPLGGLQNNSMTRWVRSAACNATSWSCGPTYNL